MPVTFDATELALGTQESGGAPTSPHVALAPTLHPPGDVLRHAEGRLDRIGGGQGAAKQLWHAQANHRERFLHPFSEAGGGIRVQTLQPASRGLQTLEGLVVVSW